MRRPVLAVLGGSFDPPHIGHVLIPTYLLTRGLAARVVVAPCWSHPFAKRMSPFLERLAWTRLAMGVHGPQVDVTDLELRLAEGRSVDTPSYSYELLTAIAAAHPNLVLDVLASPAGMRCSGRGSAYIWRPATLR